MPSTLNCVCVCFVIDTSIKRAPKSLCDVNVVKSYKFVFFVSHSNSSGGSNDASGQQQQQALRIISIFFFRVGKVFYFATRTFSAFHKFSI